MESDDYEDDVIPREVMERSRRHKVMVGLVVVILVVSVSEVWYLSTEKERLLHKRVLRACGSYGYVAETHLSRYLLFSRGIPVGCIGFDNNRSYGLLYNGSVYNSTNDVIIWTDWRTILPDNAT